MTDGAPDIASLLRASSPEKRALLARRLDELEAIGAPDIASTASVSARGDVLVAFVVRRPGAETSEPALRRSLAEVLPDYMIPATIVFVDELPVTSTGKVDKRRLPDVTSRASSPETAPGSEAETTLVEIWADVLGVDEIGVNDNFFEVGGDSLLSIRILARARQAGIIVSPKDFFDDPTVAAMARAARVGEQVSEPSDSSGELPLTPIQRWFFERDFPERHHWNQATMLEVPERLDPSTIASSIAALVAHHDALRLRFERTDSDGSWKALVDEPGAAPELLTEDLSSLAADEQIAAIERTATKLHAGLDLSAGCLLRAVLFDRGNASRWLLIIGSPPRRGRALMGDLARASRDRVRAECQRCATTALAHGDVSQLGACARGVCPFATARK